MSPIEGDQGPNKTLPELQVYTRRTFHHNSKDLPANHEHNQSSSPTRFVEPCLPGSSNPFVEPEKNTFDLNISIALRKGVRTCTQHPITKYVSYNKLSSAHRAFTTRISQLFVPRIMRKLWKIQIGNQ